MMAAMPAATREPLSFDDAQILGLESEAIKGHTGKLLVLEPDAGGVRLDPARLRARAAERIEALPLLRRRVETPRRGGPYWVENAAPELEWHVASHELDEPLDDEGFRSFAGEILAQRLPRSRPLWRLDAVPLERERRGIVGRIHHAVADGVTAIRTISALLWDEAADGGVAGVAGPGRSASRAGHGGDRGGRTRPEAEQRGRSLLLRLPGALRRELRPGRDTPLDRHIGPGREVAWTAFELDRLKRIGHGAGGTVNDAVLAVVAGGLHRWLQGAEATPATIRAQVPVSLHVRDEAATVGNRDSFLNVDLPIAEPDPGERLRSIVAETSERKLDHDAETLYAFFHAVGRFRPLYRGITRVISGPREFALSVSNVPGPRRRPAVCGHEVREFCTFAEPADRHALRVAVISLGDELAFGLCSDPEAIGGLERLADALEQAVLELEAGSG